MKILEKSFYRRDTLTIARELLGQKLVRIVDGQRLSAVVAETEAYLGTGDSASHASRGRTPRNQVMFGPAGMAYVYFVYGMHYMLNVVTEAKQTPGAVLLRAVVPLEGIAHMQKLRNRPTKNLTDGPAKLCQALAIDTALNGLDLTRGKNLWLEGHQNIPDSAVMTGPRIGIGYAAAADRKAPWRFVVKPEFRKDQTPSNR
jgi:DNA-3-methyladenine glycosylase